MINNKVCTIIIFVLFLCINSKGQSVITNKELNIVSHKENAELLKKSLEESLASDLEEVYLIRDSLKQSVISNSSDKEFSLQKEGKNIKIKFDLDKRIKYEEKDMSQDSLMKKDEDFIIIELEPDGKIGSYSKQEQNKTTVISFLNWDSVGFIKKEKEKDSSFGRQSNFYPNGKLRQTREVEYRNNNSLIIDKTIGFGYSYDEKGVLITTYGYEYDDSLFEFTREEVITYIKKMYPDYNARELFIIKHPRHTVNGEIKKEAQWQISIHKGMTVRSIGLDGKTGKKLYDDINLRLPK